MALRHVFKGSVRCLARVLTTLAPFFFWVPFLFFFLFVAFVDYRSLHSSFFSFQLIPKRPFKKLILTQISPFTMHSLSNFAFTRVLNEDPILKTLTLLGTVPVTATAATTATTEEKSPEVQSVILIIEKTHFATQSSESDITRRISELLSTGSNDIYHWWNAIILEGKAHDPDLKMTVISPATEAVCILLI